MLNTPAFRANLAAIEESQTELATRLRAVIPPEGTRIAVGRDGSPVAVLAEAPARVEWLGGSSMPTISAPIAVEGHHAPFASVVLLGIGTGYEPRYLANRLAQHCAVFVAEPDIVKLALALAAADSSDLIRGDRVVLLDGDVEASLSSFLSRYRGFECPAQLFSLSGTDSEALAGWSASVQRAVTKVQVERANHLDCLARDLARRVRAFNPDLPSVLVVTSDPGEETTTHIAAVARSLERLGLSARVTAPQTPASCSTLARVEAVRDFDPDALILINTSPADLAGRLPPKLPVICWFLESRTLRAPALVGLDACPLLVAASSRVRDELITRGARPEAIRIIEAGLDEALFEDAEQAADRTPDIVVVADVEDLSPEAIGIRLQTQAKLWRRLVEVVRSEIENFAFRRLDDFLKRAEREADVRLTDAEQRSQVRALAAALLPKALSAVESVKSLIAAGLTVHVRGRNWSAQGLPGTVVQGPIPTGLERRTLFATARLVVIPYVDADGYRYAQEALAEGTCSVLGVAEGEAGLEDRYPQTGHTIGTLPSYRSFGELTSHCRSLFADPGKCQSVLTSAARTLRVQHTTTHQVQQLLNLVRGQAG